MISGGFALGGADLSRAAGHVRAALGRAGYTDLYLVRTGDGFRVRGVRGGNVLASMASFTPLVLIGVFSRCGVEVQCRPSLQEGDDKLHFRVKVRSIREFDNSEEWDMITRGPVEIIGDFLQNRRVFRKTMDSLTRPTDAPPERFDSPRQTPEQRGDRVARARQRYHEGSRRRMNQLLWTLVAVGLLYLLNLFLGLV